MSVYVDELIRWPQPAKPGAERYFGSGKPSCHMTADSLEELHAMADRIGLRRSWCQYRARLEHTHYDLTPSKRALAVRFGAMEKDLWEAP